MFRRIALLVLCFAGAAQADIRNPPLRGYTLSMDKIEAMQAASKELSREPGLWFLVRRHASDDLILPESNAASVLQHDPAALAILARHHLTVADAVTIPAVLNVARWADMYDDVFKRNPNTFGITCKQFLFYRENRKALEKMDLDWQDHVDGY